MLDPALPIITVTDLRMAAAHSSTRVRKTEPDQIFLLSE